MHKTATLMQGTSCDQLEVGDLYIVFDWFIETLHGGLIMSLVFLTVTRWDLPNAGSSFLKISLSKLSYDLI